MLDPRADSLRDAAGIALMVLFREGDALDTLGQAVTDAEGRFRMAVRAPEKGVYPLFIAYRGVVQRVEDLVVAQADTATLRAPFPVGRRPIIIRSRENAAWLAYKNTRLVHSRNLQAFGEAAALDTLGFLRATYQTIGILWNMSESYGGTMGADLAAAQSVVMLEGLDDSLLVARARVFEPERTGFVEAARAARRAHARRLGLNSSIALLDELYAKVKDPAVKAELLSEYVTAYADFNRIPEAEAKAGELQTRFEGSEWARWAAHVRYDFQRLMPGMPAPELQIRTREGDQFRLSDLEGSLVLLEFYAPQDPLYQEELHLRNNLIRATAGLPFSVVSVSTERDTAVVGALARIRPFPGIHAIIPDSAAGGDDIRTRYNLHLLPRRFLIAPDGKILSKYDGRAMAALQQEVALLLSRSRPVS